MQITENLGNGARKRLGTLDYGRHLRGDSQLSLGIARQRAENLSSTHCFFIQAEFRFGYYKSINIRRH